MAQQQIQEQKQEQVLKLSQSISQQQLLQASLVELPVTQLMERIQTEMDDNPALEVSDDDYNDYPDLSENTDYQESSDDFEREERQSALDDALNSIGRDDEELPVYQNGNNSSEEREEMVYGETLSFYDHLKEQMGEVDITDSERDIMEYLIGSLDDDGLLRKDIETIADELAIYHNIDVSKTEIEKVLHILQEFDPAGIGGRSLQECLLLQIDRREPSKVKELMATVIDRYFEEFTKKNWKRIQSVLKLNDVQTEALQKELRKLNPKPGASMGETVGRNLQQITPDFIVETQDDGTVSFSLNGGEIPELHVSQSFIDTLKAYQENKESMTRQMKEALLYTKKKVEAAQSFIDALVGRRNTLIMTMRAIIQWQHRFFEDGDETSIRPMILKDIAEKTGLSLSTISRVSNSKYAQTRWGTYPLRHFFSDSYVTESGEEMSTRQIKATLRDMIDSEDKQHPLSDEVLKQLLTEKGFPIARRTIAKYREQMGIPIARLRK
ncbi:MAG: RNA polymerase factor sigma-54 [Prevotella sp.]|nr:RNA polymerase factor sigma-54 [Prevotella sp.]